ncbi:MAG: transcription termination factor Rho [Lachnospiraceae bacterium]|nr:transcription termination factor Rho [Candidatus Equihabitans merdae]
MNKMTKERYETLQLAVLRDLAKTRGMKGVSALKKADLIQRMLEEDVKDEEKAKAKKAEEEKAAIAKAEKAALDKLAGGSRPSGSRRRNQKVEEPKQEATVEQAKTANKPRRGRPPKKSLEAQPVEKTVVEETKTVKEVPQPVSVPAAQTPVKAEASLQDKDDANTTSDQSVKPVAKAKPEKKLVKTPARRGRPRKNVAKERAVSSENEKTVAAKDKVVEESSTDKTPVEKVPVEKTAAENASPAVAPTPMVAAEAVNEAPVKTENAEAVNDGGAEEHAAPQASEASDHVADHEHAAASAEKPEHTENTESTPVESSQPQRQIRRDVQRVKGILEVMPDGFGFLRSDNFMPGEDDVYVSPSQIRRFQLKTGDMLVGMIRPKGQTEKFGAMIYVETVNDLPPDHARHRFVFENMTPTFPTERIRLERPDGSVATRIVDLISPIGKGQRGMIVSPPKAGKTTLLKDIARSILRRNPEAYLMILLIDERPEEVTDMKESIHGENVEIIYSTFDEMPEHHKRVSEMVIERAKRLVEHQKDVVILLDSITRLARAYNVLVTPSGKTLSGGLDPTALYMPKRFFGAARNMKEGGSLTILATALVDTGSKMDDVVYEEFKGTGNMELILDRHLQERRIFPAVDIVKSGTRREDLLLTDSELEAVNRIRRSISGMKADDAIESILKAFIMTKSNDQVVNAVLSGRIG